MKTHITSIGITVMATLILIARADPTETTPGHYQQEYSFTIKPAPTDRDSEQNSYKHKLCQFTAKTRDADGKLHRIDYYSNGLADYLTNLDTDTVIIKWSRRDFGGLGLDQIGTLELSSVPKNEKEWTKAYLID